MQNSKLRAWCRLSTSSSALATMILFYYLYLVMPALSQPLRWVHRADSHSIWAQNLRVERGMYTPHDSASFLTKSLFLLKSSSARVYGLPGANTTLQPLLPCQRWPGSSSPPTLLVSDLWGMALSALPSFHVNLRDRRLLECKESPLQYNLSPWAAYQWRFTGCACHRDPAGSITDLFPGYTGAGSCLDLPGGPKGECRVHSAASLVTHEETEASNGEIASELPPGRLGPV